MNQQGQAMRLAQGFDNQIDSQHEQTGHDKAVEHSL